MSREIDLTKKLSKDEREYLEARGLDRDLDANALALMGGGVSEEGLSKPQLQDKLKEMGLSASGSKPELEARLSEATAADDTDAAPSAEGESDAGAEEENPQTPSGETGA